tara:strand:- start:2998 stop:3216 length:219 start_codon:yes stop_codon:yes gene_type:complete
MNKNTKVITHHYTSYGDKERFEAKSKFNYEIVIDVPNRETYSVFVNSYNKLKGIELGLRMSGNLENYKIIKE